MRIRKRFLVESSLRSDPHLRRSRPPPPTSSDPPFDHIMAIRSIIKTWLFTEDNKKLVIDETFKVEETHTFTHNIRSVITTPSSANDHQAMTSNKRIMIHDPSSSSSAAAAVQGNWYEGDNELDDPLKKRNDSFKRKEETALQETSIKCNNIVQFEVSESTSSGGKKMKRGNVIMEGSRCSRVNGRGWRCCQPTLVGYSLCEHHLGKGRLRSMSSARRHAEITQTSFGGGEEERKLLPLGVTKKRTRIVKARSLNSLLGQI